MSALREIIDLKRREGAKKMRARLFQKCREAAADVGDEIAGFALVVWDEEGYLRSAYDASRGPIRAPLVPTLAADALNRHLAVAIAKTEIEDEESES